MVFWHFHGPICPSSKITSLLTTPHSAPALVRDSELLFPMHFNLPWQALNSSCHFITWPLSVLRLLQLVFICTSSNNLISPANNLASSDVLRSPRLSARILLTVPVLLFAAHSFISEKIAPIASQAHGSLLFSAVFGPLKATLTTPTRLTWSVLATSASG